MEGDFGGGWYYNYNWSKCQGHPPHSSVPFVQVLGRVLTIYVGKLKAEKVEIICLHADHNGSDNSLLNMVDSMWALY